MKVDNYLQSAKETWKRNSQFPHKYVLSSRSLQELSETGVSS